MSTTTHRHPNSKAVWLLLAVLCSSCQTLSFYGQVARGQITLLGQRVPVSELIDAADTPPVLRARLVESRTILDFAEHTLQLAVGGRYSSYVSLDRPYALWNVVAAGEFSVDAKTWCYPLAGCAGYRGYFDEADAHRAARRLASKGYDVRVAGVAAYSTLGWFDDPLLSSFIDLPLPAFAGLLFHELAHSRLYLPGDTAFNEAFAAFVERQGVAEWLSGQDAGELLQRTALRWRIEDRFSRYMLAWREQLAGLYARDYAPFASRALKDVLLRDVASCYRANREAFDGRYDQYFAHELDNARFVALAAYRRWVPSFARLFHRVDGDWGQFYDAAQELARVDADGRRAALEALAAASDDQHDTGAGDDQSADQIECETLSYHRPDADIAGAEHDHVGRGGDG